MYPRQTSTHILMISIRVIAWGRGPTHGPPLLMGPFSPDLSARMRAFSLYGRAFRSCPQVAFSYFPGLVPFSFPGLVPFFFPGLVPFYSPGLVRHFGGRILLPRQTATRGTRLPMRRYLTSCCALSHAPIAYPSSGFSYAFPSLPSHASLGSCDY